MLACLEMSEFGLASTFSDLIGEIPSRTISGEKTTRQVSIFRQDFSPVVEKPEDVDPVVVLSRVAVFRGQTIVDGDHHGLDLAREAAANVVVGLEIGGEVDEAAAVEEDDDREAGIGLRRDVDAEPEVARGIDGDVRGTDAVAGLGVRRRLESDVVE